MSVRQEKNDIALLLAFVRDRDESAFAALIDRHAVWIFAAARRRLHHDDLADDATQAVFIVLASKAAELIASKHDAISAWLFHVVHFTCSRMRRAQTRRRKAEMSAGQERLQPKSPDEAPDGELMLLMEESIVQLPKNDRDMVVRRFYQRQAFAEIGDTCGLSAEAARKRVSRALAEVKERMLTNREAISNDFLTALSRPTNRGKPNHKRIEQRVKESMIMAELQPVSSQGGHQMISAEFLVRDVEANLEFFEKLGFPRRFIDKPDASGRIPRASLTAGRLGKIWIRRAEENEIRPSPSINVFFWIDGGPDGLIAHRKKLADSGLTVTSIIDEHGLPNFNVQTPDGYSIAFFTSYVAPGEPPMILVN